MTPEAIDDVVARPLCAGEVVSAGAAAVMTSRFWAAPGGVVVEAAFGDAVVGDAVVGDAVVGDAASREAGHWTLTATPSELAATLARLCRLGPRPRLPGAADHEPGVRAEAIGRLFDDDRRARSEAAAVIAAATRSAWGAEWVASLTSDPVWRATNCVIRWAHPPDSGSPGGADETSARSGPTEPDWPVSERGLLLLDSPVGLATLVGVGPGAGSGDRVRLVATDPTRVWLELITLVPTDAELGLDPHYPRSMAAGRGAGGRDDR